MAGAGIGTDGTSFQFMVSENNWLGRGIKLDSSVSVTERTIAGDFAVLNPNYNYTGNAVFTSLFLSSSDMTTSSGYKNSKTGESEFPNTLQRPAISNLGANERKKREKKSATNQGKSPRESRKTRSRSKLD